MSFRKRRRTRESRRGITTGTGKRLVARGISVLSNTFPTGLAFIRSRILRGLRFQKRGQEKTPEKSRGTDFRWFTGMMGATYKVGMVLWRLWNVGALLLGKLRVYFWWRTGFVLPSLSNECLVTIGLSSNFDQSNLNVERDKSYFFLVELCSHLIVDHQLR